MKLRGIGILCAVAALVLAGCGDDITNIIEQVVTPPPVESPTSPPPESPTAVPPTATAGQVTATPTATEGGDPPTPTSTPSEPSGAVCGNGVIEDPEQCDDGGICVGGSNDLAECTSPGDCPGGRCTVVGGQPTSGGGTCSANCTLETVRTSPFGQGTGANVQALAFGVPVELQGSQTIRTGRARADDTVDINGETTFRAGDYPAVTKVDGFNLEPARVLGLVCACVRGVEVPAFGAGNSATGVISCGGDLDDLDYVLTQDHRTDPLQGFNVLPACAHDADPTCSAETEIVDGVVSRACRVGEGADCLTLAQGGTRPNTEAGYCNSAREVDFAGNGPQGSALIYNNIAIGLLMDRGLCNMGLAGMNPCPEASYGPDCIPCTDDDADLGVENNNPTTTGTAKAVVYNAGNTARAVISSGSRTPCTTNADCQGATLCGVNEICLPFNAAMPELGRECGVRCGGNACQTERSGRPFDCEELAANPNGGLNGGSFAVCFPSISARTIGDNVTCATFAFD